MNYYNLLGLPFDATKDEIRKAYFDSAKKFHPDVNSSNDLEDKFLKIQEAYDVLIDESKRVEYDTQFSNEIKKDNLIQFNAYYSRSVIPLISEEQVFYLLLDIFSTEKFTDDNLPTINLCLVVDTSTSMQGAILDKIKFEIANLFKLLKPEDVISLVTFSDRPEIIFSSIKVEEVDKHISKIYAINASGSTEILKGLNEGVNILNDNEQSQTKLLYLITDGHTYGDEEDCIELIRNASDDGIIFQAIGVGEDWNDDFLDNLSKISGGETQFVTTAQELYNSLKDKLMNFGVLFSKSTKISFNLHPNVKINYAFRLSPELSRLEVAPEINLGGIYSGKHLRVIFELIIDELPDTMNEIRLSYGSIKVEIPKKLIRTVRFFYDFKRAVLPKVEKETISPVLVDAVSSLSLYRLQEKAREDVKEGEYMDASKRLHHLATHLISKGNRDLVKTILTEVENIQQTQHFSELGKKRIKYGTRALLMLPEPSGEE